MYDAQVLAQLLDEDKQYLQTVRAKALRSSSKLWLLQAVAMRSAMYQHALKKNSEDIITSLQLSAEAGLFAYRSALTYRQEITYQIGDSPSVTLESTSDPRTLYPRVWSWLYWSSTLIRAQGILDELAQLPLDIMENNQNASGPAYVDELTRCLKQFSTDGVLDPQRLINLMEMTDPDNLDSDFRDYTLAIDVPKIELLYRIGAQDETAFNESLSKSLEKHHLYYTSLTDDEDDPDALMSLPLAAICAIAHDRGINIHIESEYLPLEIIRNQYVNS